VDDDAVPTFFLYSSLSREYRSSITIRHPSPPVCAFFLDFQAKSSDERSSASSTEPELQVRAFQRTRGGGDSPTPRFFFHPPKPEGLGLKPAGLRPRSLRSRHIKPVFHAVNVNNTIISVSKPASAHFPTIQPVTPIPPRMPLLSKAGLERAERALDRLRSEFDRQVR
jgi:hypothetical protein